MERVELDANEELGSGMKETLELLPELESLAGKVSEVVYQQAVFNGVPQYITNAETSELILDANGNKIPKKEFKITVELKDHTLKNGKPRRVWINIGASLGEKANLPKFLANLGLNFKPSSKAKDIIDLLTGIEIKLQLVNKRKKDGNIFQKVVLDTVRCTKKPVRVEDIEWKD